MKKIPKLFLIVFLLLFFGCSSTDEDEVTEKQLTYSQEVMQKFSSKEVEMFLSTPYKEDREPEFSSYVKMLTDKRVDENLKNELISLVKSDKADRFYVANMIYLMSKAGFPETFKMIKQHLFSPDIYTQVRSIKGFRFLAEPSDKKVLLELITSKTKSAEVIEIAKEVYLFFVRKNNFDDLFDMLVQDEENLSQDSVRKNFIFEAINYCLDKMHTDSERDTKDSFFVSRLDKTSEIAQEFIVSRLKGRFTAKTFDILVSLYCELEKSRNLHILVYDEILRLVMSDLTQFDWNNVEKDFEDVLTTDLVASEKNQDMNPNGIVIILSATGINQQNQHRLEEFIISKNLTNITSYTVLQIFKLLMKTANFTQNLEKILYNAIYNPQLHDDILAGLTRMTDDESVKNQPNVVEIISEFITISTKQQNIRQLSMLLSKIGTNKAIEKLIEGLKSHLPVVSNSASVAIIALRDKSYFTLEVRQNNLIEDILRNKDMSKYNIIATLKILGEIGTKVWDRQLMLQYCRLQDDKDVAKELEKAVAQIDSRGN